MRSFLHSTFYILLSGRNGVVALITALLAMLFLFSVVILITTQSDTSIFAGQFNNQADKAQSLAVSGIQDALLKVATDKNFYNASYTISSVDGTTTIMVASGTPMLINVTSSVMRAGETVHRAMQAQVTLDQNGTILNVTTTNQ